jgi:hypothetical protein
MNQEIISLLNAALECSIFLSPTEPGLSYEEILEVGERAGFQLWSADVSGLETFPLLRRPKSLGKSYPEILPLSPPLPCRFCLNMPDIRDRFTRLKSWQKLPPNISTVLRHYLAPVAPIASAGATVIFARHVGSRADTHHCQRMKATRPNANWGVFSAPLVGGGLQNTAQAISQSAGIKPASYDRSNLNAIRPNLF